MDVPPEVNAGGTVTAGAATAVAATAVAPAVARFRDLDADAVVVGAGVVGLAVARALAGTGREVLVLEREAAFGTGTSARNSEVVHAGIYYPAGSLKARCCVAGRRMLYDYCASRGVAHRRAGKLVVACDAADAAALDGIAAHARANGVDDLGRLDAAGVARLEPEIVATAALLSPSTGIVDSHGLMLSLLGEAEARGAALALRAPATGVLAEPDGAWRVEVGGEAPASLRVAEAVNAAGLDACAVAVPPAARSAAGGPGGAGTRARYAKGSYFRLESRAPAARLVYPVPEPGGLGVHLTLDLAGRARFGPDVEWVEAPDYAVDPGRAAGFYAAIRRYWPGLPDGALAPDYAGVRPKVEVDGIAATDFLVRGPAEHGARGRVDLLGIESPGLTSCLALAGLVREALDGG